MRRVLIGILCVFVYRSGEGGEDLSCLRICDLSWATVCGVLVGSVETNGEKQRERGEVFMCSMRWGCAVWRGVAVYIHLVMS
jgi:hypothetical protein